MRFQELEAAIRELGLTQKMTARDVKERYRTLVKLHHPDHGAAADNDDIRRITEAYKVVSVYLQDYQYDFSKVQFYQQYPEERLREQFYDADLWCGKG